MEIDYAVRTHPGKIRRNNEDNYWVNGVIREKVDQAETAFSGHEKDGYFAAAVCDGMGGEENGELASLIAVSCMRNSHLPDVRKAARDTVSEANRRICEMIIENNGSRSGTTFAAIYIDQGKALCCNVGDSRVYLCNHAGIQMLTTDHNRAQTMLQMGLLSEDDARSSPLKHCLTQYLGIFEDEMVIEPSFSEELELEAGDVLLLCTDGLTDMIAEKEIYRILQSESDVDGMCNMLMDRALEAGGKDNITAVVCRMWS